MIDLCTKTLRKLEDAAAYFKQPTGDALRDEYHKMALSMFSSPDSSGIQEQVLADALGSIHKGGKKLGADATLDGVDVEIKPCKSEKSVSAVNITDDTPARLIKDIRTPEKILVIGRCPGGIKFRWVIVCPMSDFSESRYKVMCQKWKHEPEAWPETTEKQINVVERLAEKRTKNDYQRSQQLKFTDIKTVLAGWVHPEIDKTSIKKRAEDNVIKRISDRQTSVPQMAL